LEAFDCRYGGTQPQDGLSYRSVGIPPSRIFTINSQGELKVEYLLLYKSTYLKLTDLVDQIFPPDHHRIDEDYSDFAFWRQPLPALSPAALQDASKQFMLPSKKKNGASKKGSEPGKRAEAEKRVEAVERVEAAKRPSKEKKERKEKMEALAKGDNLEKSLQGEAANEAPATAEEESPSAAMEGEADGNTGELRLYGPVEGELLSEGEEEEAMTYPYV
jgi:hypothetical protein